MGYKDLEIYKLSHTLAIKVHKMILNLPRFEMYEEGRQIRKSSKAIPANIVEGYGRKEYQQDYRRYLIVAHASCNETIEHLAILYKTGSLTDRETFDYLVQNYDSLSRRLNKFIQAFNK